MTKNRALAAAAALIMLIVAAACGDTTEPDATGEPAGTNGGEGWTFTDGTGETVTLA